jgi:hypothetical protein
LTHLAPAEPNHTLALTKRAEEVRLGAKSGGNLPSSYNPQIKTLQKWSALPRKERIVGYFWLNLVRFT